MSATTAKPFQPYTSALNTTASGSTSNAYQFIQIPRNLRRSHTAERSYRKMDPHESSFHYDRPPKSEALKEMVQSPFINGKRNENYINPTYYSSNFLNQSMEVQRGRVRENQTLERSNSLNNSKGFIQPKPVQQNPIVQRDLMETPKKSLANIHDPSESRFESESKNYARNASVKKVEIKVEREQPKEIVKTPSQASQANEGPLDVCDGCYNWGLAYEGAENRKKSRASELAMERAVMEYNNQQLKIERERESERKEATLSASRYNHDTFSQKKARAMSRDRLDIDDDLNIKPHSKGFAPESLRSLQRYQSMLDKMYEQSVKKIHDRKSDLSQSQSHNRSMISKNQDMKNQEKQKHSLVAWNDGGNEKSLLDRMHDNSATYSNAQSYERRRASEYNHRAGHEARHIRNSSPANAGPIDDPFKRNAADCEDSVVKGKSILDKMYQSSFEYWRRQKDNLKESSKANKDVSSSRKHRNDFDDEAFSSARAERQRGMLDHIYSSDEKGLEYRKNGNRDCSSHNRDLGYATEAALAKAKTLESYYKSPAKKVGESMTVDYDKWTHENSGVFSRINLAVDKLEHDRKAQVMETGYSLKSQINESIQKKKDEHVRDRTFKETPLLVCSHKANLMYCNICNRKVPMNKITKIIGDYKKIMKNKGLSSGR